eukprot:2714382-Pleurochrysis_carterae.AAC.1
MIPTIKGQGASAGAGAGRGLQGGSGLGGAQARSAMGTTGIPELRKRSAGAPQVLMRCECNLGNCACECQTATKGDSFRSRTA